jgi:hypothetical protein
MHTYDPSANLVDVVTDLSNLTIIIFFNNKIKTMTQTAKCTDAKAAEATANTNYNSAVAVENVTQTAYDNAQKSLNDAGDCFMKLEKYASNPVVMLATVFTGPLVGGAFMAYKDLTIGDAIDKSLKDMSASQEALNSSIKALNAAKKTVTTALTAQMNAQEATMMACYPHYFEDALG